MTLHHSTIDDIVDISSIDISDKNGLDKVPVIVTLDAAVISKLRNQFPADEIDEEINFTLDKKTFEANPILKYDGKTKIRSEVLKKLKGISDLIQNQSFYPNLKLQHIRAIVKDVLGDSDPRTYSKYIKAINDCIYSGSGKKLSLFDSVDCSCFVLTVKDKISEMGF